MSAKIRHNKKRNTIFIYEALVRNLTKATIEKDFITRKQILDIMKESFSSRCTLARELKIYQNILETKQADSRLAEKILSESKIEYSVLDKKQIFAEQSRVISKINKRVSKDVFSTFVPNYKNLATIQQMFNNLSMSAKERVLLEQEILSLMTEEKVEKKQEMRHIDSLVYKSFADSFNKSYSGLLEEQKELLSNYISSDISNSLEFKIYLDGEIDRLKEVVKSAKIQKEFVEDSDMATKANKVLQILESFGKKPIEDGDLIKILKMQELAKEIKK